MYKEGTLDAFNGQDAPWGHGPTNTTKWIKLARPVIYRVDYQPKYEPFVILARHLTPWADERFVGYGGNKIAYVNQLDGLGFGFHVHPYGFTIHVPHVRTRAANLFVLHKQRGEALMEELRQAVEVEIRQRTYVPVIRGCKPAVEEEEEEDAVPVELIEEDEEEEEEEAMPQLRLGSAEDREENAEDDSSSSKTSKKERAEEEEEDYSEEYDDTDA